MIEHYLSLDDAEVLSPLHPREPDTSCGRTENDTLGLLGAEESKKQTDQNNTNGYESHGIRDDQQISSNRTQHDTLSVPSAPISLRVDRICGSSLTVKAILCLSLLMEAITCVLRFGFGLESTRDTADTVGRLSGGIRIHHGYVGIVMILVARWCCSQAARKWWIQVVGWSLICSDLMHHFLVLWPLTGSPHFDLVYHHYRHVDDAVTITNNKH